METKAVPEVYNTGVYREVIITCSIPVKYTMCSE